MSEYPYDDDDEHGAYCDCYECRLEEDLWNCSQFLSDGYIVCGAIGSEHCDWCPFYDEIGTKA